MKLLDGLTISLCISMATSLVLPGFDQLRLQQQNVFSLLPKEKIQIQTLSEIWSYVDCAIASLGPREVVIDSDLSILKPVQASSIPRSEFNQWLLYQRNVSFHGVLNNIGGYGYNADNVSVGCIIASPSKSSPNYFYQWVRDSAITINTVIEYLYDDNIDESIDKSELLEAIDGYINNIHHLQRQDNRSGKFKDGYASLGEPKFMVNGDPFNDSWGRPQRDGPGLRALSVANYIDLLDKLGIQKDSERLSFIYNEVLKPDLTYVTLYWDHDGFDLWEETSGLHFFTSLTQLKALRRGIELALRFEDYEFHGELKNAYTQLRNFIVGRDSGFQDPRFPHIIEHPNLLDAPAHIRRNGLDIATIIAALRSHDVDDAGDMNNIPFGVDNARVLNTLTYLVNDMKFRYPLNQGRIAPGLAIGMALGRYPEDTYNGVGTSEGNPWFISTSSAGELIYKLLYLQYKYQQDFVIDSSNREFYEMFLDLPKDSASGIQIRIPFGSDTYRALSASLIQYADSFLDVIREHVDNEGQMSEQFNRYNGYMQGAEKLTWSFGSVWSCLRWRNRILNLLATINE
ncbi:BA75_04746T0 [Komagataella pastoris]|uniref:glucan 1,4-alpha-glucosidase n=1 Tax=Komagataella pastoris TaxID=4922 RepID=A0A1B2JGT8_PICPA|nr:BA75_04746T0 [Komagataella pastoris]